MTSGRPAMLAGTVLIPAVLMVIAVGCDSVARGHAPEDLFTTVARARVRSVAVFDEPGGKRPRIALSNPDAAGAPLVFIVRNTDQSWLQVELPVRPNGSLGWISRRNVELSRHDYRIVVDLGAHMITVSRAAHIVDKEPVGIGTRDTPTPGGSYYTTALVQPPDPSGLYGPYVYVLSGYSDVLRDFAGGNGVIGIHGTNEPWDLGKNVSHGCIRMSNNGITRLAHMLPLGVPVDIRP